MRTLLLVLLLVRGLFAQPLVLLPKPEQVPCRETIQFRVPGYDPTTLHWQSDRGKIDDRGLFTAPAEHGPCRISATEWQDVNHTVSIVVRAVEISLRAPTQYFLHPREEGRVLIQLEFRGGEFDRKLIWKMGERYDDSGSGDSVAAPPPAIPTHLHDGRIDATGWVRAPSGEGTYPIEIALAADPRIQAIVQLQVVKARQGRVNARGEAVQVHVQPVRVDIHSGEYQAFSSFVSGTDLEEIGWSLAEDSKDAEVDPSGTFRASKPGTYHLRATSFQYPECWGEAEVVVAPAMNGLLKPEEAPQEDLVGMTLAPTGSEGFLLLGGWNGKVASTRVLRLDFQSNSLRPHLQLQVSRTRSMAVPLTDGTILVAGGIGNDGRIALKVAERVDPDRKVSWRVGTTRWCHIGGLLQALPEGRALLVGGCEPDGRPCGVEVFETTKGAFRVLDERPWPSHAAAVALKGGRVLILGGELNRHPVALVWRYDPVHDELSPIGRLGEARSRFTATLNWDEREIFVAGGRGARGVLASVERFDPLTGTSRPSGGLLAPREGHAALLLPTGMLLVFGGGQGSRASRILENWDPDANAGRVQDQLSSGAWLPFLSLRPDGSAFVYGLAETALGTVPLPPSWEAWD